MPKDFSRLRLLMSLGCGVVGGVGARNSVVLTIDVSRAVLLMTVGGAGNSAGLPMDSSKAVLLVALGVLG